MSVAQVGVAQVGRDGDGVTRLGVCAGQRPSAQLAVGQHGGGPHCVDVEGI
jgi:hypothetical protein